MQPGSILIFGHGQLGTFYRDYFLARGVTVVAPDVGVAKEAGAIVVPRSELAEATIRVLQTGERGMLKMRLLTAEVWTREWRESL